MQFTIAIIIYGFAFVASVTTLNFLKTFAWMEKWAFRSLTGGFVGGLSAWYLAGVRPFLSLVEASLVGDFGISGYLMLLGIFTMLGTWAFNLRSYGVIAR